MHVSHLLAVIFVITVRNCDARSTKVSAQYTVGDASDTEPTRTFGTRGIVEDVVVEDGGILTKYSGRPTRVGHRAKKRPTPSSTSEYDPLPFKPEFFAVKGTVLDDDEPIPPKPKTKTRPTRQKTVTKHTAAHSSPSVKSNKNPFRFPAIQNEEIFETKLQEAPSNVKKYKTPGDAGDAVYTYSTIKFGGDDDDIGDSYVGKTKSKGPKRSTSISQSEFFKLEQSFGGDGDVEKGTKKFAEFGPPTKFKPKSPAKLFKSPEDEFTDSESFDFSIRGRPQQSPLSGPGGKFDKFKSDLGVKSLAIKQQKNKYDPPLQGGFKPSFKLRDFPNLHGSEYGSGIASPGQIKTFFEAEEADRDERIKYQLSHDSSPASKAQYQQFLRAKEDERLEKLVEEQFRLQQQKQIAKEREEELKQQQQQLRREKEKIKLAQKELSSKVTRQAARTKRRPVQGVQLRQQRNPNPINFSVLSNNKPVAPLRTVSSKDGSYRVSFNVK